MTYFAKFLEKLAAIEGPDGTSVLHNSMIVYAGGNADGNAPFARQSAGDSGRRGRRRACRPGRFHEVRLDADVEHVPRHARAHGRSKASTSFGDSDGRRAAI